MSNAHSKTLQKGDKGLFGSVTCSPARHFQKQMTRQHVTARRIDFKRVKRGVSFELFISLIPIDVRKINNANIKREFNIVYIREMFSGNVTCHMTRSWVHPTCQKGDYHE